MHAAKMTPLSERTALESINRTVYGLLGIVTLIFSTILFTLEYTHQKSDSQTSLISRYHVVMTESALETIFAISNARYELLYHDLDEPQTSKATSNKPVNPQFKKDQIIALKYQMLKYRQTLSSLMSEYQDEQFDALHTQQLNIIDDTIGGLDKTEPQQWHITPFHQLFNPLVALTNQLLRLHQTAHRELLINMEQSNHSEQQQLVLMIFILTGVGFYGVVKLLRDVRVTISKLHRTQELLKQSEQRLLDAEHISRMGYVDWDLNNKQMSWSKEIYHLHGFDPQLSPSLQALLEAVHHEDKTRVTDIFNSLSQRQHHQGFEYRLVLPDQKVVFLNAKVGVDVDSQQKPQRVLLTLVDITEHKLIELELEKYRHHLEDLVEERTKKLEEAQQSLMKRQRLTTLGQLTATVSHELRNPLGAMRPALYILEQQTDTDNERIRGALQRLDRNILRCDNIIDELLDFTRIRDLNKEAIALDSWLKQLIEEQISAEDVELQCHFTLDSMSLYFDNDRLTRAVNNVLKNALEAMMDNAKFKRKKLLRLETGLIGHRVEIAVSDNGKGIDAWTMEHIFEPLFSTKTFGVGLGMPTIKHIMEQHEGGIEISSEPNIGSTVTLWLPKNALVEAKKDTSDAKQYFNH